MGSSGCCRKTLEDWVERRMNERIDVEHPNYAHVHRMWLENGKPGRFELSGQTYLKIEDGGVVFIAEERPKGFDGLYNHSSISGHKQQ